MEDVGYDKRHLVVSGLMATFKKIWEDAWSARMEYILTNTLLALLEYPDATLLGVNRMYTDKEYRKKVIDNVKDPVVKDFLDEGVCQLRRPLYPRCDARHPEQDWAIYRQSAHQEYHRPAEIFFRYSHDDGREEDTHHQSFQGARGRD